MKTDYTISVGSTQVGTVDISPALTKIEGFYG